MRKDPRTEPVDTAYVVVSPEREPQPTAPSQASGWLVWSITAVLVVLAGIGAKTVLTWLN